MAVGTAVVREGWGCEVWPGRPTNERGEMREDEEGVDDEAGAVEHDDADNVEDLVDDEVADGDDDGHEEEEKEAGK